MNHEIAVRLLFTLAVVFAVAGVGMMVRWAFWGRSDSQSRMGVRFGIEAAMLATIWVPAYLGGVWVMAAAVVLGCLCAAELYGTFEFGGDVPWKLSGILIGFGLMLLTFLQSGIVQTIFPLTLVLYWILRWGSGSRFAFFARARRTCFGVLYPFLCLAFLVEIGKLPGGFGFVVFYMGLTEVNDSAAYLVGSSIGKRKIFPRLSPNKTVEGVIGGVVGTVLVSFALAFAVPEFSVPQLVGAALLIAIAGLCGDLFASRLKRRVGVKDYGEAIPTQGGVLDVYDAFIFVTPVFYYYLTWIGVS
ncbi:MAG: phosphatidate cytidylyltransferase [Myxococcota bacterium]|nr:phosphatidate cytidylyltransferase [Myxococcota bacterium]